MILITPIFSALSCHQNSQSQCSSYWTSHNFQIPLSEVALYSYLLEVFLIDLLKLRGIFYKSFPTVLPCSPHYNIYHMVLQQSWLHNVPLIWLVQYSCSVVSNSLWPKDCRMPGFPVHHHSRSLLKFMSIESMMPSNHLILCHPLLLSSILPRIRVFSNESVLHIRWPKYWNFSFTISPSNEYSGMIYFRSDLIWSLCSPRDSQEFSPTLQFNSVHSLVLSFLYSPTLISIHNFSKNHSFD